MNISSQAIDIFIWVGWISIALFGSMLFFAIGNLIRDVYKEHKSKKNNGPVPPKKPNRLRLVGYGNSELDSWLTESDTSSSSSDLDSHDYSDSHDSSGLDSGSHDD